jgi:hypothetical protein
MAITGKPQKLVPAASSVTLPDEQTVRKLIHKGGSVATAGSGVAAAKDKPMLVQLRLYADMVQEIDAVRDRTRQKRWRASSRHEWIVKAIEEKLERERGE